MRRAVEQVMWSLAVAVLMIAGTQVLAGCGSAGDPPVPAPLKLGAEASGSSIRLAPGQTLEISLAGNPTTGYSWTTEAGGDPVLRAAGEPTYAPDTDGGTLVGGGGTYTFAYEGAGPGTTRIELAYRRAWETGVAPLERFTLEVAVE